MYQDLGLGSPRNEFIRRNEFTRRQPYKYTGNFINGLRHGRGTYTQTDGGTWESEWDHGVSCGIVTYTYPNGIRWEGRCSRLGMGDGWGTYTIDGTQHEGEWHLGGPEEAKRAAIEVLSSPCFLCVSSLCFLSSSDGKCKAYILRLCFVAAGPGTDQAIYAKTSTLEDLFVVSRVHVVESETHRSAQTG